MSFLTKILARPALRAAYYEVIEFMSSINGSKSHIKSVEFFCVDKNTIRVIFKTRYPSGKQAMDEFKKQNLFDGILNPEHTYKDSLFYTFVYDASKYKNVYLDELKIEFDKEYALTYDCSCVDKVTDDFIRKIFIVLWREYNSITSEKKNFLSINSGKHLKVYIQCDRGHAEEILKAESNIEFALSSFICYQDLGLYDTSCCLDLTFRLIEDEKYSRAKRYIAAFKPDAIYDAVEEFKEELFVSPLSDINENNILSVELFSVLNQLKTELEKRLENYFIFNKNYMYTYERLLRECNKNEVIEEIIQEKSLEFIDIVRDKKELPLDFFFEIEEAKEAIKYMS